MANSDGRIGINAGDGGKKARVGRKRRPGGAPGARRSADHRDRARTRLLIEAMEERSLLSATISGLVFEDYNANGAYDTTSTIANAGTGSIGVAVDHGMAGVTVTAYDNAGVSRGTATTAADGTYSLAATGTGPYRVVFTNLPAGDTESPNGATSKGAVQIVPATGSTTASLGVSVPSDYSPDNPLIATNQYIYGDPINGAYSSSPSVLAFPYSSGSSYGGSGNYALPSSYSLAVPAKSVGATFGLAFNPASGVLYASSYTKRFAGYGPNAAGTGTTDGAIYSINPTTGAVSVLADLNTIFGANTAGVDFRSLPSWTGYNTDGGNTGYDSVGKTSLGGMAVSPDGKTLYVMNLADRNLYAIPTSGPINSTTVKHVSIPFNAPGATGTLGGTVAGDLRPFAVTYYNGSLYVGIVNSAQSTQNKADLKAYVYAVNPTTLAFGASPVFQTSLNYARGNAANFSGSGNPSANWNPWSSTFTTLGSGTTAVYAQPMLSGIAFDASGNMVLGLRDRDGDQTGFFTNANPLLPSNTYEGIAAGDTLRAFINTPNNVASGWTLENNGRGPSGQGAGAQNTNLGPGGASFYYQQNYGTSHSNVATGGVAELPGFNDVITSSFDPGTTTVRTGGIRFINNTTGATDKAFQIYNTGFNAPPQSTFGKAAGIGDIAAYTGLAPIEIGDRVFQDLNDDGLQDPGDPGIAGVTVHLYQGSTLVGTTVTDATGAYLFNSSDVPGGLAPNTAYQVRFDNASDRAVGGPLAGEVTSRFNADPGGGSGSKVVVSGGVFVINVTTGAAGANDHTLDAGFVATGQLSGTVYNDTNNNGVQQTGEPGIAGVTVTLTGTDDLGNPVSVTATTDSTGAYTFAGLRPSGGSGYTVTETLPAGEFAGKNAAGTLGGSTTAGTTTVTSIPVAPGASGTGITFGNLLPASLAGFVYSDANNDGVKQSTESGIAGVTVTLTGTDDLGNPVNLTTTTLADGSYSFANLRPSNGAGYAITETQPAAYLDGKDTIGTPGGTTGNDVLSGIVLGSGVNGTNNNFGDLAPASLAGRVYYDANNDGVKQSSEAGIAGVTLTLTGTDDRGNPVSLTTTTASDGTYSFANLRPSGGAGYTITETQPAAYLDGKDTIGTPGGTQGNDVFSGITLAAGVNGTNNNFGELLPASLAGYVYVDASDDGVKQSGEVGIAGVTVKLTGTDDLGNAVSITATTASDGSYSFNNLRPSSGSGYTITETQPAGFLDGKDTIGTPGGTAGNDVLSGIVTPAGTAGANNNFGELVPASLAGSVYIDANNDGRKQTAEAGIAGVTVTLTGVDDLGNNVNMTATTAADGSFTFSGLRPSGTAGYTVTDTPPTAYTVGKNAVGSSGGTLSGANAINQVGITSGAAATRYTFGMTGATLAGTAFVDANADGVDNNGEAGLAGVTVTLKDSGGNVVGTATSAADGTYSFANLPAGSYTVVETPPSGYGASTPASVPVSLSTSGQSGVNFGSTTASVAGRVFTDVNSNGTYDPGVDLVGSGSTVTLTGTDVNGKAVSLTTTTAADGTFSFTGLLTSNNAGYTVKTVPPTGVTAGTATAGTAGGTSGSPNDTVTGIKPTAGQSATGYMYPEIGTVVSGVVYVDDNANGTFDPSEVGVGGVTITLTPPSGPVVTTTTNSAGAYTFVGVAAGTYTITETLPAGYAAATTATLSNVNVPSGGVSNENFGLFASSLAGTVYNDFSNNGALDPGEPGIAGVTVQLLNSANSVIATTTTASDGTYLFKDLPAGTYTIQETQPTAYGEGQDSAGTPAGTTSTIDVISGIALPVHTAGTGYNFGERGASITGTVYLDNNANNAIDPGEPGFGGVTIHLLNASGVEVATTVSAADGTYSFPNLPAGNYTLHEDRPNGYGNSAPTTRAVTLSTTGTAPVNYGLTTSTLSGQTFVDLNNDGLPEAGEPPIPGVTVTLIGTDANGRSVIQTTTTDATGAFQFTGLLAGTYSIAEAQPSAYRVGKASAGTSGGTVGTDLIVGIGLGSAVNATGYDFGSLGYPISGTVFVDSNGDGVQEPSEVGLAGVPLTLSLVNPMGVVVATTVSAADGSYTFDNVAAGNYTVVETPPSGYGTSTPTSIPVTVTNAGMVGENFGVTTSSLSGRTFLDANRDNAYTAGVDRTGAGLPVTLTGTDVNGKAVNLQTTTAADGTFTFAGLIAGTYDLSAPAYAGVIGQPALTGGASGTVSGLDHVGSITLAAGTSASSYLFPATGVPISGTVFNDANRDGTFSGSEAGVAGVTVTLTYTNNLNGQTVTQTTVTDPSGNYSFPSAAAEDSTITIAPPAGYAADTPTTVHASVPTSGLSGVNFGLTAASIGGTVFADAEDDGHIDPLDPMLANVVLLLTGTDTGGHAVSLTTTTGADGSYLFGNLNPGTYHVQIVPPAGYLDGKVTAGTTGGTAGTESIAAITVATGQASTGNNFAELAPASLAGAVYIDADDDGNKDATDVGIGGVTVTLTGVDDLGNAVNLTTTTRASGNYSFTNLRPSGAGGYTITETRPAGYLDGDDNAGTQGGTLGDRTITGIALTAGTAGTLNNFAELTPGVVSGTVFVDSNDNGDDDPGEVGIAGVTVTLTGLDDLGNAVSLTTTTAADGTYRFTGLRPSGPDGYTVTETAPAGYLPGQGTTAGVPSTGVVKGVQLASGGTAGGISFPELLPASLSGYVYQDLNDGGAKGVNEPGIAGVTVTLTGFDDEQNPVSLTTTTDANGLYTFSNLRPSLNDQQAGLLLGYTINEIQPTGFLDGKDAIGTPGGTAGNDVFTAIPVVSGTAGTNNDFGELPPATLSGFVYNDADDDGVKQTGEAGIAGVTVTLTGTDDNSNPVSLTTTTAADGSYSFSNLRPSNGTGYTLTETQPAGYLDGKDAAGTRGGTAGNDTVSSIMLAAGNVGAANNFGEIRPSSVAGFAYVDANGDGVKQPGESGIPGLTVTLTGVDDDGNAVSLTTTTAADGSYMFLNLRPSNVAGYTVTATDPSGYLEGGTTPGTSGGVAAGRSVSRIVLQSGTAALGNNFASVGTSSLSGFVYFDANKDGAFGAGDTGLAGVTVLLTGTDTGGHAVKTFTTTAADGSYHFDGLAAGTYVVTDNPSTEYVPAAPSAGSASGTVSGNTVSAIPIGPGVAATAYNFPETGVSVAGTVFNDTNGDGVKQAGEPGRGGVVVTLKNAAGQVVATTTTAADGSYEFDDLSRDNYTVVETVPAGSSASSPASLAVCCCDTTTGLTGEDFGLTPLAPSLSGFVYVDANSDGRKSAGEAGIAGDTVTLTGTDVSGHAVALTTVTAADGSYHFNNLAPGTYAVSAGPVAAYGDGANVAGTAGGAAGPDGRVTAIVLATGSAANGYDFGKLGTTLSGSITLDGNPVAGATVTASQGGKVVGTATTGADGTYGIDGLPSGQVTVVATGPGEAPQTVSTTLPVASSATANFALANPNNASISGFVYRDADDSGTRNGPDTGLGGVLVALDGTDSHGVAVSLHTYTAADGSYHFTGLPAGNYAVREADPAGFIDGAVSPGSSGGSASGRVIASIPLAAGASSAENDFGHVPPAAVTGYVYLDANRDGVFANEFGIANVTVVLHGTDAQGHSVVLSTITAADGSYAFTGLLPGSYETTVGRPTLYFNAGADNVGTAGGVGRGDAISSINVAAGTLASGYDFGEQVRSGCVLSTPTVTSLVRYGPPPSAAPASLLKRVTFPASGPVAYYLPTLAAEVAAAHAPAVRTPVVRTLHPVVHLAKPHPTTTVHRAALTARRLPRAR